VAPDGLIASLREGLAACLGRSLAADERLGIAVSGGPDSMALLDLARRGWPGRIEAATVDHGLRAESAAEAAMVARWCAAAGVPHAVLRPDPPLDPAAGNLQARARAARYALLEAWRAERALDWLLTAHQADDQIETLLMRLNRGAGLGGLAGIRARNGRVLRPLLGVRRAALQDWVDAHGIPHVADPSNHDARFDRAALRARIAGADWIDAGGFGRTAGALAGAEDALAWATERLIADHVHVEDGVATLGRADLPPELLRRLLLHMIAAVSADPRPPRGDTVAQAIIQLCDGKRVSMGDCLAEGGGHWSVRRAPPRKTG
jgi:tRNA(Ile)-lysidine synthase